MTLHNPGGFNYGSGSYSSAYVSCNHTDNSYWHPFKIDGQGGQICIAGAKNYDAIGNCDLIINAYTSPISLYKPRKIITCTSPELQEILEPYNGSKVRVIKNPQTITLDWTDFGVPDLEPMFWRTLFNVVDQLPLQQDSKTIDVLFSCQGGHGRTGTAMCCLLIGSGAYDPLEAIKHVRQQYCNKAVENEKQEQYVWDVGRFFLAQEGHDDAKIKGLFDKYEDWVDKYGTSSSVKQTTIYGGHDVPPKDPKTAALLGYGSGVSGPHGDSPAFDAFSGLYE